MSILYVIFPNFEQEEDGQDEEDIDSFSNADEEGIVSEEEEDQTHATDDTPMDPEENW